MTKDEALKLALEALEDRTSLMKWQAARDAVKKALAAPVQDSTCNNSLREQGKAYPRTCRKCGKGPCIALANAALDKKAENARELGLDYEPVLKDNSNYRLDPPGLDPAGGTQVSKVWWDDDKLMAKPIPFVEFYKAAPDLQAELDATNRQVEILSDALAESRREVAALKAVQEPVAWPAGLIDRIKAAEQRIQDGHAPRRIPADPTDVDLVLAEVRYLLEGKQPPFWIKTTPPAAQRQWVELKPGEAEAFYNQFAKYQEEGPDASGWWAFADAIKDRSKELNT